MAPALPHRELGWRNGGAAAPVRAGGLRLRIYRTAKAPRGVVCPHLTADKRSTRSHSPQRNSFRIMRRSRRLRRSGTRLNVSGFPRQKPRRWSRRSRIRWRRAMPRKPRCLRGEDAITRHDHDTKFRPAEIRDGPRKRQQRQPEQLGGAKVRWAREARVHPRHEQGRPRRREQKPSVKDVSGGQQQSGQHQRRQRPRKRPCAGLPRTSPPDKGRQPHQQRQSRPSISPPTQIPQPNIGSQSEEQQQNELVLGFHG